MKSRKPITYAHFIGYPKRPTWGHETLIQRALKASVIVALAVTIALVVGGLAAEATARGLW